jgi:uncharacterized membrane protein YuzA (DUF378 family)
MLEPAIALGALIGFFFLDVVASSLLEESLWLYVAHFVLGAAALYCVVRIIHWAWETPIPFIGAS